MAVGVKQTHVKGSKVDMSFLAELARNSNAEETVIESIKKANTARHVSEIIQENTFPKNWICLKEKYIVK